MLAIGCMMTAPEVLKKVASDIEIEAVSYAFRAGGLSAFFNPNAIALTISANGVIWLKLWDHTTASFTAASGNGPFTTATSGANRCVISGLTVGRTYTPWLMIDAQAAGYTDLDWYAFGGSYVQPLKTDPEHEEDQIPS